jgi:hypothetical protein
VVAYWSVPPEWKGETGYIVAGGPSVAEQDLSLLRGRRVVAINSSWWAVPWADFLFFGDHRWWCAWRTHLEKFAGRIVTVSDASGGSPRLLHCQKVAPPPALAEKRSRLVMQRTSLQAAINLCVHLGVARIVLLGADMRAAKDGRTHHHSRHPWPLKPNCWQDQMRELEGTAPLLAERGIEVINTSTQSRIGWWPKAPLADCL